MWTEFWIRKTSQRQRENCSELGSPFRYDLGDDSIEDIRIPGDSRYGDEGPEPQRHSMPIIDDYDSPTDDDLLSTMAKV